MKDRHKVVHEYGKNKLLNDAVEDVPRCRPCLEDAPSCDELMAKSLGYDGATLTLMMKKDYLDKKKMDRVEKAAANVAARPYSL